MKTHIKVSVYTKPEDDERVVRAVMFLGSTIFTEEFSLDMQANQEEVDKTVHYVIKQIQQQVIDSINDAEVHVMI